MCENCLHMISVDHKARPQHLRACVPLYVCVHLGTCAHQCANMCVPCCAQRAWVCRAGTVHVSHRNAHFNFLFQDVSLKSDEGRARLQG